ncbi:MAG TPA: hypothetical protein VMR44_05405 [Thermoanaerobaculia bacterium]|nr:hypothetical protein [Thermoanaerobaculia bacterium]
MVRVRPRPARSSPPPLRAVATLVLAVLAAVSGVLEVHPHAGGTVGDLAHHAAQGESIFLGASHPAAAPHVEPPGTEVPFRCPVCLLHFHSAGEAPERVAAGRPPEPPRLGTPSSEPRFSAAALQPGGTRGPPVR